MPDWSYRTVIRPILFQLPPALGRDVSLGVVGALGKVPVLGPFAIDFLGHMAPDRRLATSVCEIPFRSRVGLGCGIDVHSRATSALARFGFGFVEVGPVVAGASPATAGREPIVRDPAEESIATPEVPRGEQAEVLARRLSREPLFRGKPEATPVRVIARLVAPSESTPARAAHAIREMASVLAPYVSALTIEGPATGDVWHEGDWHAFLRSVASATSDVAPDCTRWLVVSADLDATAASRQVEIALENGFVGVSIDGRVRDPGRPGWRRLGKPAHGPALRLVREIRERFGSHVGVMASGGVHEPVDALEMTDAGADLVAIDSGLVYSGPGLPKRANEAILHACGARPTTAETNASEATARPQELSWFWLALLGVAMLIGGGLALAIAATRVVLPYDEHFVAMTRDTLETLNARLLPFMAHDRVALAGTMVTIGIMYCGLAWFGVRRGLHWAFVSIVASGCVGFASFFLFLGFGYLDPLHAFVTAVLFQLMLLGTHCRLSPPELQPAPELRNTLAWRCALWGQSLFVAQAIAFIVAGMTISYVGVTSVFVPEDLMFLDTSPHELALMNPRVLSLVAHDRASFGGMLVASGVVFLTSSLWGFRRGARWFWWTTLLAGAAGYAPAIVVHFAVGYENLWHLTPAFLGFGVFVTGLALSYPFLCRSVPAFEREWNERASPLGGRSSTRAAEVAPT